MNVNNKEFFSTFIKLQSVENDAQTEHFLVFENLVLVRTMNDKIDIIFVPNYNKKLQTFNTKV